MAGEIKYEKKAVQTVRGTEGMITSKLAKEGWELVDQQAGRLKVTLNFQRPKKPLNMLLVGGGVAAAVLMVAIIGIGAALEGDDKKPVGASTKSTTTATPASTSPSKVAAKPPTKITVDELLDKLNAASLGGIKTGDRFEVTGEMFESDAWSVGASGDYAVYLKAKGGADDLLVLLKNEGQAGTLQNGTKVQMVLEASEVTINEEKTDGWMRAVSVKVLAGGTSSEAKAAGSVQAWLGDVQTFADTLNKSGGQTVIDRITPGMGTESVDVYLNVGMASFSPLELKTHIKTMNEQIVDLAESNDAGTPEVRFYLGGDVVAKNRSLMDPWDVKFEGLLDD